MADIQQMTFLPLGNHSHVAAGSVDTAVTLSRYLDATKILIQSLAQNIRFTFDSTATSVAGFRITSGNDPVLVPIKDTGSITVIAETAGAGVEYQWGK